MEIRAIGGFQQLTLSKVRSRPGPGVVEGLPGLRTAFRKLLSIQRVHHLPSKQTSAVLRGQGKWEPQKCPVRAVNQISILPFCSLLSQHLSGVYKRDVEDQDQYLAEGNTGLKRVLKRKRKEKNRGCRFLSTELLVVGVKHRARKVCHFGLPLQSTLAVCLYVG